MGCRGNVCVKVDGGDIFFYTHWSGNTIKKDVASALDRGRSRWDDDSYLARIIFSEMIQDSVLEETGYGIALSEYDKNVPTVVVDTDRQVVTIDGDTHEYTFGEFISEFKIG